MTTAQIIPAGGNSPIEYTGRTLESIIRREFGRDATLDYYRDPREPRVGRIVREVRRSGEGRQSIILGVVVSVEGKIEAAMREDEEVPAHVVEEIAARLEGRARMDRGEDAEDVRERRLAPVLEQVEDAHQTVTLREGELEQARSERGFWISEALRQGATVTDVADLIGVSRQSIYNMTRP